MLEPTVYKYDGDKLIKVGSAKIEFQTPEEYLRSTPLVVEEVVDWGKHVIRFLRLKTLDEPDQIFVLVERFEDKRPDPQWAIIQVEEKDLTKFRENFQVYCEKP